MNNNIITEERLLNSYIVNNFGVLRAKYVQLAKIYGYNIYGGNSIDGLDHIFVYIDDTSVHTLKFKPCSKHGLTLEDFRLHEEALCAQNEPQSPVSNDILEEHNDTLEDNKRSTCPSVSITVENGSACDTSKDIFKEMLNFAQDNNCLIQFNGFTGDENACIVVTFASSDDEFVVQSVDDFKKLIAAQETLNKFLRGDG